MVTFVMIPGLMSDARVWRPLAEALAAHGSVVDADHTGSTSMEDSAADFLFQFDGPLVPVGHSMGGRIAFEMARQAPDRVVGVVAADTGHDGLQPEEVALREDRIAQGRADFPSLVEGWLPPMVAESRHDSPLFDDLKAMALAAGPEVHERQILALMGRPTATDYLPELAMPVLLLTGSLDEWSPPQQHRDIAALLPDAELVVVEGAGHFLPIEDPDATIAAVEDWVSRRIG